MDVLFAITHSAITRNAGSLGYIFMGLAADMCLSVTVKLFLVKVPVLSKHIVSIPPRTWQTCKFLMTTSRSFNLAMENAIDKVTIRGSPSGMESTIIRNASMKSLRDFRSVSWESTFYCNPLNSLTMYNSSTMNMANAAMHPMNTRNLAIVSNALDSGDYSSWTICSSSPSSCSFMRLENVFSPTATTTS